MASRIREWAARWDARRDAPGTVVLSDRCMEMDTGRTLDGWRPGVSAGTAPNPPAPPCHGNVAASWQGSSALPGTARSPGHGPLGGCFASSQPRAGCQRSLGTGRHGRSEGWVGGRSPHRSTAVSSHHACPAVGLPAASDGTYGATATTRGCCGSPALRQLLVLLLGLLHHLEGEGEGPSPRARAVPPAEPAWALNGLGDRDGDGFPHELPGSAPPWSRASSCHALRALGSLAPCPGCSWG